MEIGLKPYVVRGLATLLVLLLGLPCHSRADEAPIPVEVAVVRQLPAYAVTRRYAGDLVSRRDATLAFRHAGNVAEVRVDLGESVAQGDVLARLDGRALAAALHLAAADVAQAEAAAEQARAMARLAADTRARHAQLVRSGHVSAQRFDEVSREYDARQADLKVAQANIERARAAAEAARIELEDATLTAPFDAVVQARLLDEGSMVSPGQPVLRLVERAPLEAHVGVPADVAAALVAGNEYLFDVNNDTVKGRFRSLLPEADAASRAVVAVFDLAPGAGVAAGIAELVFERSVPGRGLWVPLDALTESHRGLWALYAIGPDGTVQPRLVEVLHSEADRAFVRGTLGDGERIVAAGAQRLVPGQRVAPREPAHAVALAR